MPLQIVNPLTDPLWDERLLDCPGHSFFHSAAWARVLTETYGYTPHYLIERKRGGLKTVVPLLEVESPLTGRRGVSLPFTDYCDPLLPEAQSFPEVFERLTDFGRRRDWDYLELRGTDGALEACPSSAEYFGHRLALNGEEGDLEKKLRSSTLRNIKKAAAGGVEVEILHSPEGMEEFCRLNSLTRRDHGLPPQPRKFFENIHKQILSRGLGFLSLARKQGQAIAGVVFFRFGKTAVYKYGASDRRYQSLRSNNLLMWEAICRCREEGLRTLCLGRTDLDQPGLKQYKDGWGGEETRIRYIRYDFRTGAFRGASGNKAAFSKKFFQKMPIPLLNSLGALLYRHAG
jgi:hypothetical protein